MPAVRARGFWSKILTQRFPTLIGIGLLMLGVGAGIVLVGQGTGGFLPRASESATPKQVRITNITESGFTVSFLTDLAAPGYIQYGTQENRTTLQIRDDRDQLTNQVGSYQIHHITVRGLQPSTQYYFRIGTGSSSLFDNAGKPFSVRTASQISAPAEAKTAFGQVLNEVSNPAGGSVVYLSIDGASPLSALVKTDGSWALPLTGVRTRDLSAVQTLTDVTPVRVQVQGERQNLVSDISTTVGALSPMETITLGKSQSAAPSPSPTPGAPVPSPSASPTAGLGGFMTTQESQSPASPSQVQVEFPLRDNEVVNTTRPELFGEAPANAYLQIEIHSENVYNGVVQTDGQGNWRWTPPGDLEPGEHTVTVTYTDANGVQQRVQRKFVVQAATQTNLPSFVATPSTVVATTPTPRATTTPIALATATPTPRPTSTPVATSAPRVSVPATASAQPVSGSGRPTLWLAFSALGLIFFGLGSAQKLFSRNV